MTETTKKENVKNAICYIPFVAVVLYFVEENKTSTFIKHMNYWIVLFSLVIIINMILSIMFLSFLWYFISVIYIIISMYFGFKAWSWEEIKVDILDKIVSETLAKIK